MWWIIWLQIICQFPRKAKKDLNIFTRNFTAFFTASKGMCHLESTLGAFSGNS